MGDFRGQNGAFWVLLKFEFPSISTKLKGYSMTIGNGLSKNVMTKVTTRKYNMMKVVILVEMGR